MADLAREPRAPRWSLPSITIPAPTPDETSGRRCPRARGRLRTRPRRARRGSRRCRPRRGGRAAARAPRPRSGPAQPGRITRRADGAVLRSIGPGSATPAPTTCASSIPGLGEHDATSSTAASIASAAAWSTSSSAQSSASTVEDRSATATRTGRGRSRCRRRRRPRGRGGAAPAGGPARWRSTVGLLDDEPSRLEVVDELRDGGPREPGRDGRARCGSPSPVAAGRRSHAADSAHAEPPAIPPSPSGPRVLCVPGVLSRACDKSADSGTYATERVRNHTRVWPSRIQATTGTSTRTSVDPTTPQGGHKCARCSPSPGSCWSQ